MTCLRNNIRRIIITAYVRVIKYEVYLFILSSQCNTICFRIILTTSQSVPPGDRVVDQSLEPRPIQVPGGEVGQRGGRVFDAAVVEVRRGRGHPGGRDAGHAVERPLLVADRGRGPGGRRPRQYLLDAVRVARRAPVLHLGHRVQRGQGRAAAARHVQKVEHGRQHVVVMVVVLLLGQHHCRAQRRPAAAYAKTYELHDCFVTPREVDGKA